MPEPRLLLTSLHCGKQPPQKWGDLIRTNQDCF